MAKKKATLEQVTDLESYKQYMLDNYGEPGSPEWKAAGMTINALLARHFDSDGFKAFFELFTGVELHREGLVWADKLFEAVNGGRKLLQKAWRGSGKTTVISKYFFAYFMGHHPERTNLIVRINLVKARETAGEIARLIEHDDRWAAVFENVVPDKASGWGNETGFYLKRSDIPNWPAHCAQAHRPSGPTFIGYGYDSGSMIGTRVDGIMDVDDIHDRMNTRSDRLMREVKGFVRDTLKPMLVPKKAFEVWCYTPWRTNDAYADREATGLYLLNESPVMRPAEEGDDGAAYWEHDERIPYSGQWYVLSWPEMFDFEFLAEKFLDIGQIAFAQMYLLDLEATMGVNLKADWLHQYPGEEIKGSWPVFFGVDYASTQDKLRQKDRDYFAMSIWRAIPGGGIVLVDGVRSQMSKGEALATVGAYMGIYPTLRRIGVESIGKGEEFYNDLLLMNDDFGRVPPLFEIGHHRVGKGERFENWMAPRFMSARAWVSDVPTPFMEQFHNEWLLWPNTEHDDCLDAAYMGMVAAEGFMPAKAQRTFNKRKKKKNLAMAFART